MTLRGFFEKPGGWLILSGAAVLGFILINLAVSKVAGVRLDLTEDRLYTLSPGTENILTKLDKPVSLTLYYSATLGNAAPIYGNYASRVKDMLRVLESVSGGNLTLTVKDPKPFSEIEDDAVEHGLQGVPLDQTGEKAYFGLTAAAGDKDDAISFLQIERENFLEYDLANLIHRIGSDSKTVLAIYSTRPIFGDFQLQLRGLPAPPTALVEQLRAAFDVRQIFDFGDIWEIKPDVLMIVHPSNLDDKDYYNIDQYLLRGGKAMILVDPFNETAAARRGRAGPMGQNTTSDMAKLFGHWGINLVKDRVAGDWRFARLVNAGTGQQVVPARFLTWMAVKKRGFSGQDAVTSDINLLHIQSAGIIERKDDAAVTMEPLVWTTRQSQAIDVKMLDGARPEILKMQSQFKASGKAQVIAARIRGRVKSLFPDGPPKEEKKAEDTGGKKKDATGGGKAAAKKKSAKATNKKKPKPAVKADKAERETAPSAKAKPVADKAGKKPAPDAKKDALKKDAAKKEKEKAKAPPFIPESSKPMNVILVADVDLLEDRFWVRTREFFGQRIQMPFANNADFVVNAIENLSGGDDLIGLRSRGTARRPFTKIAELRIIADTRFRAEEQLLRKKLSEAEKRLAELGKKKQEGTSEAAVTKAVATTAEAITQEVLITRKQLRLVQLALREDIEALESSIRFVNIALVPILVGLVALLLGGLRLRRRKRAVHTAAEA